MGLSLRTPASRFARDLFAPWDPATNTFLSSDDAQIRGRLFRADRFTSIYHRPTRRSLMSLLVDTIPSSGVVQRRGVGEVYLVGDTLRSEVYQGRHTYDRLRQSHLAMAPSGGLGAFYHASVAGTGDNLGAVSLGDPINAYLDMELQGVAVSEETEDVMVSRFLITHSKNISPENGDFFKFQDRWFLVNTPYVDGGLRLVRSSELDPNYRTLTYKLHQATAAGYNPTTGTVTSGTADRVFSALIGRELLTGTTTTAANASRKLEIYVYLRHLGFEPKVGDSVVLDGRTYRIATVILRRDELQWKLEIVS